MWGEDGPYSQVRLCEETRILDDSVSSVFLVVEAEVNPFTFEYVLANRERFSGDEQIQQLLDHAEYRGKFGYVVAAGEVEFEGAASRRFAREQADMAIQALIRMHLLVMNECGLLKDGDGGNRFVWNSVTGRVEPADGGLWDEKTLIGSPAGVRNNKIRFFAVFAFGKGFDFKKKTAKIFTSTLEKAMAKFDTDIENVEAFNDYILATILLPFEVAPADFIETVIRVCNRAAKRPLFQKDYLVTNVKKPTPRQIMNFLGQLPSSNGV